MFNSKYTLEIISHHPQFKNLPLRKYGIDGVETVGAWGNEPFEIRFKNNTYSDVQVKLSVDGTDVLTGAPASTNSAGQMWLVKRYSQLCLKAWPESHNGGASFVFTSADNSVALNTRGDLSNRGIIAAAVFEEGYVEPIRIDNHWYRDCDCDCYDYGRVRRRGFGLLNNSTISTNSTKCADSFSSQSVNYSDISDSRSLNLSEDSDSTSSCNTSSDLKSLASVGAGSYVSQKISYVSGLKKPVLAETVKVKYVWWDELKAALDKQSNVINDDPTGFPGDPRPQMINLKGTPRIDTPKEKHGCFRRAAQTETWTRF